MDELTLEELQHMMMALNGFDCDVCNSARKKLEEIIKTKVPCTIQEFPPIPEWMVKLGVVEIEYIRGKNGTTK